MAAYYKRDDLRDPWYLQAPRWVQEDHELPISPEKPEIHDELQKVLDAAPLSPDHALLKERIGQYDTHIPIHPGPTRGEPRTLTSRSWFGAALMALFDLSPFLNFIEEAANSKHFNDSIFVGLHSLAQAFHQRGYDGLNEDELKQEVWSRTETLWNCIQTEKLGPDDPEKFKGNACHVPEFINYLLQRLEHAKSLQDEAGSGDDVDLSTRFKQLFKHSFVRHTPMHCSCPHPVLRRQPTGLAQTPGYILPVILTESMLLEQAISQAMWVEEDKSFTKACPQCGDEVHTGDFTKFGYLPEVLFISPHFMSKRYPDGYVKYTHDEKFVFPERLDMSALADDLQGPGDPVDNIYKLQSIITCTHQNMDVWTDYKPALRTSEVEWMQYEYSGDLDSPGTLVTLDDIFDPRSRQVVEEAPHILMYVRDRQTQNFGPVPDEVKHREFLPDPHTTLHDKYGLESSHLQRFVEAQDQPGEDGNSTMFETARSELSQGRKNSYWMWFMFPQILGMTVSRLGEFYGIKSLGEAIAYWKHPVLGRRYLDLLSTVLTSPETDLERLFGRIDALKFGASMALFSLICNDRQRRAFEIAFTRFNKTFDIELLKEQTVVQLYDWLHDTGEGRAIEWMHYYEPKIPDHRIDEDKGQQETINVPATGGLSVLVTSPSALIYDANRTDDVETKSGPGNENGNETDDAAVAGKRLLAELIKLTEIQLDDTDDGVDAELVAARNTRGESFGRLLLRFAFPEGLELLDPELFRGRARNLGRNLMYLTRLPEQTAQASPKETTPESEDDLDQLDGAFDHPYDNAKYALRSAKDLWPGDTLVPGEGYKSDDFQKIADDFGLDGSSEEFSEELGSNQDEENPHEAIAIPTDPNDPRIEASQSWSLDDLKAEFQKEQLDQRGLRNDQKKHRVKFLKHFELERDYSIYHESRLRQTVKDKGIAIPKGVDKADKAELVDALTEYDTQILGELEFVGEETEQTDSAEQVFGRRRNTKTKEEAS
ncbi:hypothetical protein KVR01_003454 [Diaporthe batatas]|uniref:uncharacterized protein n=1 Tax=Diaporthe batatas TaxID=748121 RepID=UPI001D050044|nr:uncharacterized protein KVR01_003454 [Diaporthe batatas]KAG8167765.1 hypothetical protein KVR01_003454 [Diaporthe batatas]